jgi:integrase
LKRMACYPHGLAIASSPRYWLPVGYPRGSIYACGSHSNSSIEPKPWIRTLRTAPAARSIGMLPGFGLMVTAAGHRSYVVKYRAENGGGADRMTLRAALKLADARKEAKAIMGRVAKGNDPLAERRKAKRDAARAGRDTLQAICENYRTREGGMTLASDGTATFAKDDANIRTAAVRHKVFVRLVYPRLGRKPISQITRSDIVGLLDDIEDDNGAPMATHTLAYLRRVFNWHAARVDGFVPPIVRGMARGVPGKRSRVLNDDEIRAFWRGALAWEKMAGEFGHPFPRLLRFTLLTATRREEAAQMVWSEIDNDDFTVWLIPAARYKTKLDFEVPLSRAALGILHEARSVRLNGCEYVFTTNGETPISVFGKLKARFDEFMLAQRREIAREYGGDEEAKGASVPHWTIHDVRRTARSLMSQAGVNPDHAERALGHAIGGVREVYDRHQYRDEKRAAFEALAGKIEHILRTVRW